MYIEKVYAFFDFQLLLLLLFCKISYKKAIKTVSKEKETPQERYAKKFKKQYSLPCFTSTEMDIIEKLESVPNKAGYIKKLIR